MLLIIAMVVLVLVRGCMSSVATRAHSHFVSISRRPGFARMGRGSMKGKRGRVAMHTWDSGIAARRWRVATGIWVSGIDRMSWEGVRGRRLSLGMISYRGAWRGTPILVVVVVATTDRAKSPLVSYANQIMWAQPWVEQELFRIDSRSEMKLWRGCTGVRIRGRSGVSSRWAE